MPATRRRDSTFVPYAEDLNAVASAARTTTGNSTLLPAYGPAQQLRVFIDVTAVTGTTPSLVISVEDSPDGTKWYPVAANAAITAAGQYAFNITSEFADRIRIKWTITGTTPSFTFAVHLASFVS